MRKCKGVVILLGAVFLIAGCDFMQNLPFFKQSTVKKGVYNAAPPAGEIVIAKVGNFYITKNDLNKEIEAINPVLEEQGRGKIDTLEQKIDYLKNEMVPRYLLYQEALDKRIDEDPEMQKIIESTKVSLMVSKLRSEIANKANVTEAEVDDFYNANKNNPDYKFFFQSPEKRKILEIVTNSKADANQANIQLLNGTDFAEVARLVSVDSQTRDKGGDLGYISSDIAPEKQTKFPKFYEIAFAPTLDKGDISSIFAGPDGKYYILKIEDIKKAEPKTRAELTDAIKSILAFSKQKKAEEDVINKVKSGMPIEIFEGKVD